ncbi:GNAT family protein [Undibacterium sp. RTI2.1]|uniref:GNAT family N-acetyltransferase n=1 Tax=unclassified Undibacterium TaxID=2630295 RepID=UPI002AB50F5E|nr:MULTISPECIES: GNAT family protein [unclassified Undibacterium]MDY7538273.1 GNAT family protein [Undibacterium sp. 5I1]MEB0030920.1 GNAT family protein [Undibacterium sp. RTI2.1]MEB0117402.1 GNAT family protein [Undibacterium sp. RTI2.2]MEB0229454.1 GNAT family protein [Undibacterium sp. 10I3]MEB0256064.1 GNAT family protein [Undibacterium sp. 5I1]
MTVIIQPARIADADAVLAFELQNRDYFEQWVHSRTDAYYDLAQVRATLHAAEVEREQDKSFQYLIWATDSGTNQPQLVGRINLTNIVRAHYNKATLGYRMAQSATGKGIASCAIDLLLKEAFGPLKLWRIEAVVRPANIGSAKVLEKNGFSQFGRSIRSVKLHGEWQDLLHFERRAESS